MSSVARALFLFGTGVALSAQTPQFDVASVKPFRSGSQPEDRRITAAHGNVSLKQQTLREMIQWAYDIKDTGQVTGPDWISVEQFDVIGKSSPATEDHQLRLMLQALLTERFQLLARRHTEERSVYALTVGRNGPKLRKVDLAPVRGFKMGVENGYLVQEFPAADIPRLASNLQIFLDHPVVNRTGLDGIYEIRLRVELGDDAKLPQPGMPFQGFGYTSGIFPAVQELGLKLAAAKAPVEVLVIDHVERPAAN